MRTESKALLAIGFFALYASSSPALGQDARSGAERATFSSAGHPKANGLTIEVQYPSTWTKKEGRRPHVVQQFVSGPANCNLLMINVAQKVSDEEVLATFTPDGLREMAPPGSRFIRGGPTKLDSLPAGEAILMMPIEQAGVSAEAQMAWYMTFYKQTMIQLMCGVVLSKDASPIASFEEYHPTFMQIANSLVVQDQWNEIGGGAVSSKGEVTAAEAAPLENAQRGERGSGIAFASLLLVFGLFVVALRRLRKAPAQ